jgi:hypothetical protein
MSGAAIETVRGVTGEPGSPMNPVHGGTPTIPLPLWVKLWRSGAVTILFKFNYSIVHTLRE